MSAISCYARRPESASARPLRLLHCSVLLLLLAAGDVFAWRQDLRQPQLLGQGEWRWFGMTIYEARLYAEHSPFNPDLPFALELTYRKSISRQRFVQASLEEMRRLANPQPDTAQWQRWQQYLEQAFVDVEPGMQLSALYLPQSGCRFYQGNQLRAEINDPAFARLFFAIWLDARSRDRELRARLLGNTP